MSQNIYFLFQCDESLITALTRGYITSLKVLNSQYPGDLGVFLRCEILQKKDRDFTFFVVVFVGFFFNLFDLLYFQSLSNLSANNFLQQYNHQQ